MNPDRETLLKMHEFYTEEARHQRSMMWETVKWFTPILAIIWVFWLRTFVTHFNRLELILTVILFALAVVGLFLSIFAIKLLRSFYRTNLIYITMFVKVQDELQFDSEERLAQDSYRDDECITYKEYRKDRYEKFESAEQFADEVASRSWKQIFKRIFGLIKKDEIGPGTMFVWMYAVFFLFANVFLLSAVVVVALALYRCCIFAVT
jgi:hypothetical protein